MTDEMTQEQMLEEQKKNCIFCKIISGEMQSKKVYEDPNFIGILDIKPAVAGHVLLLPKEHVPILPLLPQDQTQELFGVIGKLAKSIREALMVAEVSVFIASGAAAGQVAPHFMVHLIPREPGDGLDQLDLTQRTVEQTDTLKHAQLFEQASKQMLGHLGKTAPEKQEEAPTPAPVEEDSEPEIQPVPASWNEVDDEAPEPVVLEPPQPEQPPVPEETAMESAEPEPVPQEPSDALHQAILQNPELKRLLIAEPGLVEDYVAQSPNLKKLFEGVNIKALSLALRRQEESAMEERGEQPTAASMDDTQLFAFIDGNEGLRTWLLTNPQELAENLGQNPRLEKFFEGIDIMELATRYKAYKEGGQ